MVILLIRKLGTIHSKRCNIGMRMSVGLENCEDKARGVDGKKN